MSSRSFKSSAAAISLLLPTVSYARCGAVDYSWGADGLAEATSFIGTMMIYCVDILLAVAGIMVVISSFQICLKMNYHEGELTKSVAMLFGSILFLIAGTIIMPALYGYRDMNFIF